MGTEVRFGAQIHDKRAQIAKICHVPAVGRKPLKRRAYAAVREIPLHD